MYRRTFKPVLDFCCALFVLATASPLLLLLAVLCAARTRGNPLFVQERVGKGGRIFRLFKFRATADLHGRFLRATSLDELPEFLNVLKGDMSLVGPRPLLPEQLPLRDEKQMRRFDVRPGLTGLAQINGRKSLPIEEISAYDVSYARNVSFALDLRILATTAARILEREGISPETQTTAVPVQGGAGNEK